MPHLEEIRASVAAYRMAVRGANRPKAKEQGEKLRGPDTEELLAPEKILSVTISIGGAAPGKEASTPAQVDAWLTAAARAKRLIGERKRSSPLAIERDSINELRRGVFAKMEIEAGQSITDDQVLWHSGLFFCRNDGPYSSCFVFPNDFM